MQVETTYSFNKYFLSTYCVPRILLSAGERYQLFLLLPRDARASCLGLHGGLLRFGLALSPGGEVSRTCEFCQRGEGVFWIPPKEKGGEAHFTLFLGPFRSLDP